MTNIHVNQREDRKAYHNPINNIEEQHKESKPSYPPSKISIKQNEGSPIAINNGY